MFSTEVDGTPCSLLGVDSLLTIEHQVYLLVSGSQTPTLFLLPVVSLAWS